MNNPAYNLLAPLPIIGNKVTDLSVYLSGMFKIGIGLAIAFAILMIVWGGLEYILSATPFAKEDGKKKIWDAILGLLLTLGAWLLLYTINPNLVKFDVSIASLNLQKQTPVSPALTANLDSIKAYSTSLDTMKAANAKYADADAWAAAGDVVEAERLYQEGQTYEKLAVKQKAEGEGSADLKIALANITNIKIVDQNRGLLGFDQKNLDDVQSARDTVEKLYNQGMVSLTKLQDVEGSRVLLSEKNYALSTIDEELATQKVIKLKENNPILFTNAKIQTSIDQAKNKFDTDAKLISDPVLKQKLIDESADRIKRLQALKK